jgi:hypothetical protein
MAASEYEEFHGAHFRGRKSSEYAPAVGSRLRVFPHFESPYEVEIPRLTGAHGGSDALLQQQLFSATPPPDYLRRAAGHEQGAASVLVGIAANMSIANGQPHAISKLVPLKPGAFRLSELI